MVPPCSDKVSRAPPYSYISRFSTRTRLSLSQVNLSRLFRFFTTHRSARPVSLATTPRVSFDFLSCGYLDVSIHRVRYFNLCIQLKLTLACRVAPFGLSRINARSQLPVNFRRVPRPSSPLIAKASTRCPSLLDSHYAYVKSYQPHIPFASFCFLQTFMFYLELFMSYTHTRYKLLYLCKYF